MACQRRSEADQYVPISEGGFRAENGVAEVSDSPTAAEGIAETGPPDVDRIIIDALRQVFRSTPERQFSEGFSTRSTTITSACAFTASSFNPICCWIAV